MEKENDKKRGILRRLEDKVLSIFLTGVLMLNSWALVQINQIETEVSQINSQVLILLHKAGLQ